MTMVIATILRGLYLEIFSKIYVSMKENHTDKETADRNLVKSDHINQGLIQH